MQGPISSTTPESWSHDLELLQDEGVPAYSPGEGPRHEAAEGSRPARVRTEEPPPRPIADHPTGDRPSPDAIWIGGYWTWTPENDFEWTPGIWRVPPPGRFWVDGSWRRDEEGWVRSPGFWSGRPGGEPSWRTQGPPADHPEEDAGAAPGPDHFYLPGHYEPEGEGLVWKPGFWAKSQPGWTWAAAHWVRLPDGWDFREGKWVRSPSDRGAILASSGVATASRRDVGVDRPAASAAPAEVADTRVALRPTYVGDSVRAVSPLIGLADQLARESDAFIGAVSANSRILVESGTFVAEGMRVRDSALRLRQAAAAGAGPDQIAWELNNLNASYQLLYAHVRRVAGNRVGPFVSLALRMGSTTGMILQSGR